MRKGSSGGPRATYSKLYVFMMVDLRLKRLEDLYREFLQDGREANKASKKSSFPFDLYRFYMTDLLYDS